ncbi:MAG: hypothetical protein QOH72_3459 [Solirubrobacteraceae bacterium]|nr:hypothetical protein [Solirubrobacteraceae bacterium]
MATVTSSPLVFGAGWFDPGEPRLYGSRCPRCDAIAFPARAFCWSCQARATRVPVESRGRILARSRVRVSPTGFPDVYWVALVETADGFRVVARLDEGSAAPAIGDAVALTRGEIRTADAGPVIGPVFTADPGPAPEPVSRRAEPARTPAAPLPRSRPVYVAGVGMTAFGRHGEAPERLAADAVLAALEDAGVAPGEVGALILGSAFLPAAEGQRALRHLPFGDIPVVNVENACASGTTALLEAVMRVRAGVSAPIVAVGVDAPLAAGGGLIALADDDPVAGAGVTLPALYALMGDHYLHGAGAAPEAFAEVVVRSRAAAASNERAYMRRPATREEVLGSRPIADPITLYECSANADGAAAAVVVGDDWRGPRERLVEVLALELGAGLTKDRFAPPTPAARVGERAYAAAGVAPEEVDVVELHDAFAPAALISLESLGLAAAGTAAQRLLDGGFAGGDTGPALNPGGGLLSRGHPPGATGLAQVHELVGQLRGEAGGRQVAAVRTGLVHTQGGTVLDLETNACVVGLLRAVG